MQLSHIISLAHCTARGRIIYHVHGWAKFLENNLKQRYAADALRNCLFCLLYVNTTRIAESFKRISRIFSICRNILLAVQLVAFGFWKSMNFTAEIGIYWNLTDTDNYTISVWYSRFGIFLYIFIGGFSF